MKRKCAREVGGQRGSLLKKEMKKIEQKIKQEQKSKSVGRTSLINFLKEKVLSMTVKREEKGSRNDTRKEGPKKINKDFREKK